MHIIDEIRESWGWAGLDPVEIVGENAFGNLMIRDSQGRYWRLCPEDCYCRIVANNRQELDALSANPEFMHDWQMQKLVDLAREKCGPLPPGGKYTLKIPGLLGGEYGGDNFAITRQVHLVRAAALVARRAEPDDALG